MSFNQSCSIHRKHKASSGQLNCAKKTRRTHRNPSSMIESSSIALFQSNRTTTITRRMIASNLGRVFDPRELLTRVTIMPKILFQKTWDGVWEWDDDIWPHIANQFQHWIDSLGLIFSLAVPRCLAKYAFSKSFFISSGMHRRWLMEQLSIAKQLQTQEYTLQ